MAESNKSDSIIHRVLDERDQNHNTRIGLFKDIEAILKRPLVTYFTSFTYPVMIDDSDVDTLIGLLQTMDLSKGLALMISSPGGDGLAAERIINACRSFSGTGEYWAIVPNKAKSAATMVCFGASKIYMSATSELGAVDPQIVTGENLVAAHHYVQTYKQLFQEAVSATGNLEPYVQQLNSFDATMISVFEAEIALSKDIAIRALKNGMMSGKKDDEIEQLVGIFLTPESTKTHGRPVYKDQAKDCGLEIEEMGKRTKLWNLTYELYIRANNYVSRNQAKCIETIDSSFVVSA